MVCEGVRSCSSNSCVKTLLVYACDPSQPYIVQSSMYLPEAAPVINAVPVTLHVIVSVKCCLIAILSNVYSFRIESSWNYGGLPECGVGESWYSLEQPRICKTPRRTGLLCSYLLNPRNAYSLSASAEIPAFNNCSLITEGIHQPNPFVGPVKCDICNVDPYHGGLAVAFLFGMTYTSSNI
jgi:hypothetical protein